MTSFKLKKIANPLSVGEQLLTRRQEKQITLKRASKDLSISAKYLAALEEGDINNLPGDVYARSFIRAYAAYLDMNPDSVVKQYASESKVFSKTKKNFLTDFKKPVERVSAAHMLVGPRLIRGAIILTVALSCLVYLGVKVQGIISPPSLIVEKPEDKIVTDVNYIEISGKTEKEVSLKINGEPIMVSPDGAFHETIDLQKGVNVIEFSASKKHSRQTKVYRQVVVDDDKTVKLFTN